MVERGSGMGHLSLKRLRGEGLEGGEGSFIGDPDKSTGDGRLLWESGRIWRKGLKGQICPFHWEP
jgi:hypothetical protein